MKNLKSHKLNLQQNSWEWFRYRKNFVTASEIGTIMRLNPYETPEVLIKKKIFGSDFVTNPAVEHGKNLEPQANLFISIKHRCNYQPTVFERGIFLASLDGYDAQHKINLEIKCPFNRNAASWQEFWKKGTIPPYYWAQVQCGLFCSQSQKAYFLVYCSEQDYQIVEVFPETAFLAKMMAQGQAFQTQLTHYRQLYAAV